MHGGCQLLTSIFFVELELPLAMMSLGTTLSVSLVLFTLICAVLDLG